ncbi:MAG TPA: c-type cytochrome [Gammaproteobacteria bacterium]|nr:c-type cytochrome [Gammaproteobacteria bacterium]
MLSKPYTIFHRLPLTAYRIASLLGILSLSTTALAEHHSYFREEPISPIPQSIEYNENKAELGEQLFFDTRLSANGKISCASCHQLEYGGDDNVALGISLSAEHHVINTPTVFNARYNFRQNWAGSVKTLQEQIDMVVNNPHEFGNNWQNIVSELSGDAALVAGFRSVYPDGITKDNIIDAITEFEKTLITPNSRFDRFLRNEEGVLTEREIAGYNLFKELGCVSCHQGVNIGGNLYQKFGVFYDYLSERGNISKVDYGRMNQTGREVDAFVFKVPTLRNIAVTAPYLHDGSAKTLESVITIMGRTQLGRKLSKDEILLLRDFLETLTGEYKNRILTDKPESMNNE